MANGLARVLIEPGASAQSNKNRERNGSALAAPKVVGRGRKLMPADRDETTVVVRDREIFAEPNGVIERHLRTSQVAAIKGALANAEKNPGERAVLALGRDESICGVLPITSAFRGEGSFDKFFGGNVGKFIGTSLQLARLHARHDRVLHVVKFSAGPENTCEEDEGTDDEDGMAQFDCARSLGLRDNTLRTLATFLCFRIRSARSCP
jgi:hypothetical protein